MITCFTTALIACGADSSDNNSSPKQSSDQQETKEPNIACTSPRNEAVDGHDIYGLARKGEFLWNYLSDINNPQPVIAVDTGKQIRKVEAVGNDPIYGVNSFDFAGYTYQEVSTYPENTGNILDHLYVIDSANNRGYPVQIKSHKGLKDKDLKNIELQRFPLVMNEKLYALSEEGDALYQIQGCEAKLVVKSSKKFLNGAGYVIDQDLYILQSGAVSDSSTINPDGKFQLLHYSEASGLTTLDVDREAKLVALSMNKDVISVSDYFGGKVDLYKVSGNTIAPLTSFTDDLSSEVKSFKNVGHIYYMANDKILIEVVAEFDPSLSLHQSYVYVVFDSNQNTLAYSRDLPSEYANENLHLNRVNLGDLDIYEEAKTEGGKLYFHSFNGNFEFAEIQPKGNIDLLTTDVRSLIKDNDHIETIAINHQYLVIAETLYEDISHPNGEGYQTIRKVKFKKYNYHSKVLTDLVTLPVDFDDRVVGHVAISGFFVAKNEFYFEILDPQVDNITTDINPNRFKVNVDTGEFDQLVVQ